MQINSQKDLGANKIKKYIVKQLDPAKFDSLAIS